MSDQDFFFDEESPTPAKKDKASGKETKTTAASAKSATTKASDESLLAQNVTMSVALLMASVGLLVGVIVGILVPVGAGSATPTSPAAEVPAANGSAPALPEGTDTSVLPPGHPTIPGATPSSTPTATAK